MGFQRFDPRKRNKLSDFAPTASGEMVYVGDLYLCDEEAMTHKKAMVIRWGLSLAMLICGLAGGSIPAPGMGNSPLVVLAWTLTQLLSISVVWGVASIAHCGYPLRAYVYEKTVKGLPFRAGAAATLAAVTAVLSVVFMGQNGVEGGLVLFAILFFLFHAMVIGCGLGLLLMERRIIWIKKEKGNK